MHPMNFEVICDSCRERHSTEEVEFVTVEEDIQGRDVMYFICPKTQEETSSHVYKGQ